MTLSITTRFVRFFSSLERNTAPWLPGALARLVFAAVLLVYFLNSALTKTGDGFFGLFMIQDVAYFQILPSVIEQYDFDASQVPFIPWGLIVMLGTYSEIILPILIVIGLFTRLAALGMIGFVLVQSYVDIAFHGVDGKTIGSWFDNLSGAVILDQRALWMFLLIYLVIHGAGMLSLDRLLAGTVESHHRTFG
ncbi:MAG: DoxX family protein [Gammaproteobacteria bacterium]|nr:DoxX family protein [Gammaproteobacteria bacterium]